MEKEVKLDGVKLVRVNAEHLCKGCFMYGGEFSLKHTCREVNELFKTEHDFLPCWARDAIYKEVTNVKL